MLPDQIKIADEILHYMSDRNGYGSYEDMIEYLHSAGYKESEVNFVRGRLMYEQLFHIEGYWAKLTMDGEKAAKDGYSIYWQDIDEKKKVRERKERNQAQLTKLQVKIFWPTFILTATGSVAGLIAFLWQCVKAMQ